MKNALSLTGHGSGNARICMHVATYWWDSLSSFLEQQLEVTQDGFVLRLVDKSCGNSCFAAASSTTNPVDIVLNLRRHVEVNDL